ncbi:MAG TPA: glycosyltransferase family 2 protein [Anaerolineae bacterium]
MNKHLATFSPTLILTPLSRRPLRLPDGTIRAVMAKAMPVLPAHGDDTRARIQVERASVVVVTFNNLVFNRLCLESLLVNTEYPKYEIIVVDNGSTDGTPAYLRELAWRHPHVRVLFNDANRGFAAANNQGLALARGEILVLLNNDTIVPRGWLAALIQHLKDPAVGLAGPVTNRIGNEAEIEVTYRTYGEFEAFAQAHMEAHRGQTFDIRTLCMYCLAMRRDVFERLGPLDERFEVGLLEDDDYSRRAHKAGYRVVCAEDVFVHHFGQASFGSLIPSGEYGRLLKANRRRFAEKWGVAWEPYGRRLSQQYRQRSRRIRKNVSDLLPPDATVLVASKGDEELLKLNGRRAWHFPQTEDGVYAGCYPADSAEAIAHLEALRRKGGDFLLLPATAFWWLDHYEDFRQHLEMQYPCIWRDECCLIFKLSRPVWFASSTGSARRRSLPQEGRP